MKQKLKNNDQLGGGGLSDVQRQNKSPFPSDGTEVGYITMTSLAFAEVQMLNFSLDFSCMPKPQFIWFHAISPFNLHFPV